MVVAAATLLVMPPTAGLDKNARENANTYLTNKKAFLDYPNALQQGWPIATDIIEGACRHLVKDRMDLTGARWGLRGAGAILKLRAPRGNGDFDTYWTWRLAHEQRRVHDPATWAAPCPEPPEVP